MIHLGHRRKKTNCLLKLKKAPFLLLFLYAFNVNSFAQDYVIERGNFSGFYNGGLRMCVVDKNEYYSTYTANSKVIARKYKNGNFSDFGDNSSFPDVGGGAGDITRDPATGDIYIAFFNSAFDQIYAYKKGNSDNNWVAITPLNKPGSNNMGYTVRLAFNEVSNSLFLSFTEQTSTKVYLYELVSGTWTNRTGASLISSNNSRMDMVIYGSKVIITTDPSSSLKVSYYDVSAATPTLTTKQSTGANSNVAGFATTAYDNSSDTYYSFYGLSAPWMGLKVVKSVAGGDWTDMSGTTLTGSMDNGSWGGFINFNSLTQKLSLFYSSSSMKGFTWNGSDWSNISVPYMASTNTFATVNYKDIYFLAWSSYTKVGIYSTNETPRRNTTEISYTASATSCILNFPKRGDGYKVAVFARAASTYIAPIVTNGITYSANVTLGSGTQLGTSGWYCVYNGVGETVTITGLTNGENYHVQAFEYNGLPGAEMYSLNSVLTGNPVSFPNALPVSWLSFTGKLAHGDVKLDWSTASEQNSAWFEIERSSNSIHFENIGRVTATGNSSSKKDYQFIDLDPITGVSFYRLKQVDIDGKHTYSSIIQINGTIQTEIKSWFAQGTGQLTVQIPQSNTSAADIIVYDVMGRIIKKQQVLPGKNLISITGLAQGAYLLAVSANGTVLHTNRFIN